MTLDPGNSELDFVLAGYPCWVLFPYLDVFPCWVLFLYSGAKYWAEKCWDDWTDD